jgi:pimeloyl-ACP methyl ester carboxylesterase
MTEDRKAPDERLLAYARPHTRVRVASKRRINLHISGEGSPTVVLMNGLGGTALTWARVQRRIEGMARVVAYDHAGLGHSDPGPLPRTSEAIVADLRAALRGAGIAPPYVLVGQSASGLHARLFAFQTPAEVAGLVLVDASSPHQGRRMDPEGSASEASLAEQLGRYGELERRARAGTLSADHPHLAEAFAQDAHLPDGLKAALAAKRLAPAEWRTLGSELRSFRGVSSEQVEAAKRPLGDMPLVVLSAGRQAILPDVPGAEARLAAWRAMHAEAAALSTRGVMRIVDAGHNMHVEGPHFVVEAIAEVLAAAGPGIARLGVQT